MNRLPKWPDRSWPRKGPETDGPCILGINPWIHDFAAFNLWSRPVGLLACLDMLGKAGARISLMDCMDRTWSDVPWPKPGRYGTGKYPKTILDSPSCLKHVPRQWGRYGLPPDMVREAMQHVEPKPDVVIVGSIMTYWYPGVLEALTMARELWPAARIVLGGNYTTLCPEHARTHVLDAGLADLVMSGPLEHPDNWSIFWTVAGSSPPDLPSDAGFGLALDLYPAPDFAPVLGSRGCPFNCEYCASSRLYPGFCQHDPGCILYSLEREYAKGVRDFAFYDDALLVNPAHWLWPFLEGIIQNNRQVRLHTPNAMHVKNLTPEVCERLKQAGMTTIRLGLETADFEHRHDKKLNRKQWADGAENLKNAGFDPSQVGAYILFGLPEQNDAEIIAGIELVRNHGFRPHLAQYTPIPETPLFSRAVEASIYPLAEEPLFQNNSIWPCVPGGFDWTRAGRWKSAINGCFSSF